MELLTLAYVFLRIGLFSFGGGYAMLPMMYESVQSFGFISTEEFNNLLAISQVTPGPLGLNLTTYVGYTTAGIPGAFVSSMSLMLPPIIIVLLVAHFHEKYVDNKVIEGIFSGIRPVTIGLLGSAVIFVGSSSLFKAEFSITNIMDYGYEYINIIPLCIFLVVLVLFGKFKINPIIILVLAGTAGALLL